MDVRAQGLPNMFASGLSGLGQAEHLALDASERLAKCSGDAATVVSISSARPQTPPAGTDPVSALVDLRVAKYAHQASLKVLKTADELAREALAVGKTR